MKNSIVLAVTSLIRLFWIIQYLLEKVVSSPSPPLSYSGRNEIVDDVSMQR